MGHRLSSIVTRTGDQGETGLGSGLRVDKDAPVIEVLGVVDELNSWIGVVIATAKSDGLKETLTLVQHDLFDLGAQLSVPGTPLLSPPHVARIEQAFEQINSGLDKLKEFILPGGSVSSAYFHVARTVCRRAERRLVTLRKLEREKSPADAPADTATDYGIIYLNRLSDLLFVASRVENRAAERADVSWERGKSLSF
ncbi:cob(I)yrinic acid a,c-diamide adenosyltransferase [Pseudochelatococcus contaminans]|uniref:Corrinoid adenosyltransferase n=1 Tax=Pseudochelatococcus contaminans TaxID=1538103 RepID=A0A7W5Z6R4_9HYPH|nr:cob(I)yrinic acid a,c-diamide adenosyltransferase [Pseudochelatococcus contaminans]MBB3810526.1 cob(I)alamin adenosyltransferase [Pseudochelatococcus contaminans]